MSCTGIVDLSETSAVRPRARWAVVLCAHFHDVTSVICTGSQLQAATSAFDAEIQAERDFGCNAWEDASRACGPAKDDLESDNMPAAVNNAMP